MGVKRLSLDVRLSDRNRADGFVFMKTPPDFFHGCIIQRYALLFCDYITFL